jgi:hypothetical protein
MEPTVTITAARLAELEAAEAQLAKVDEQLAKTKEKLAKRTHHNLESLKAYDAAHPDKAKERNKQWQSAHRDIINAKRREQRRLKKEAMAASRAQLPADNTTPDASVVPKESSGTK